jgi:hypothetical protein
VAALAVLAFGVRGLAESVLAAAWVAYQDLAAVAEVEAEVEVVVAEEVEVEVEVIPQVRQALRRLDRALRQLVHQQPFRLVLRQQVLHRLGRERQQRQHDQEERQRVSLDCRAVHLDLLWHRQQRQHHLRLAYLDYRAVHLVQR